MQISRLVDRGKLLTGKFLLQSNRGAKPIKTLKKFYGSHNGLVDSYHVALSKRIFNLMASVEEK